MSGELTTLRYRNTEYPSCTLHGALLAIGNRRWRCSYPGCRVKAEYPVRPVGDPGRGYLIVWKWSARRWPRNHARRGEYMPAQAWIYSRNGRRFYPYTMMGLQAVGMDDQLALAALTPSAQDVLARLAGGRGPGQGRANTLRYLVERGLIKRNDAGRWKLT